MSKVNYSAQAAGLNMNTLIGVLTTGQEVSQQAPETVGNAWRTIISRIQNVKAGKFAATDYERQSEGYNEEEWTALNDVETVLGSIGIKLRSTATDWRNTEDILGEIASKWSIFDDVTKSAIANAMAGTRQREQFILAMQNWDSIQNYADLAANSIGNAAIKMEAYTESLEAAKNRVTAAFEGSALDLGLEQVQKLLYNTEADFIASINDLGMKTSVLIGSLLLIGSSLIGGGPVLTGTIAKLITKFGTTTIEAEKVSYGFKSLNQSLSATNAKLAESGQTINTTKGVSSLLAPAGGIAGGYIGYNLGSKYGEGGGALGSMLGAAGGTALVKGVPALASKIFAGTAAASSAGPIAAAVVAVGLLAAAIIQGIKALKENTRVQELQKNYDEASSKYAESKAAGSLVDRYAELAQGVNQFGTNLTLSDEDYSEFLNVSNQLAEIFPQLISFTDSEGNKILNLSKNAAEAAKQYEELNKQFQDEKNNATIAMLDDKLKELSKKNNTNSNNIAFEDINERVDELKTVYSMDKMGLSHNYSEGDVSAVRAIGDQIFTIEGIIEQYTNAIKNGEITYTEAIQAMRGEIGQIAGDIDIFPDIDWDKIMAEKLVPENWKEYATELQGFASAIIEINGGYENLDSNGKNLLMSSLGSINPFDDIGNILSEGVYTQRVLDYSNTFNSLYSNKQNVELINMAINGDYGKGKTIGEVNVLRDQLKQALVAVFGADGYDEAEKAIMLKLGFRVDEEDPALITDEKNILEILRGEGVDEINTRGKREAFDLRNISKLDYNYQSQIYDMFNGGLIRNGMDMMPIAQMLVHDNPVIPTEGPEYWDYAESRVEEIQKFGEDLGAVFGREKSSNGTYTEPQGNWRKEIEELDMTEVFAKYGVEAVKQARELQEKIGKGLVSDKDVGSYIDAILSGSKSSLYENMATQAETFMGQAFGDNLDVEGHINTFKELKDTLDECANSYKALSEAEKEQASNGKLSLNTVLDLVSANMNYVKALEFEVDEETGLTTAITLNKDAKNIMAEAQLNAIKLSILATVQADKERMAQMKGEFQNLSLALSNYDLIESEGDKATAEETSTSQQANSISVAQQASQAYTETAQVVAGLGRALHALVTLDWMNIDSAFQAGKASIEDFTSSVSDEVLSAATTTSDETKAKWQELIENNKKDELMGEFKRKFGLDYTKDTTWQDIENYALDEDNNSEYGLLAKEVAIWNYDDIMNMKVEDFEGWLGDEGFGDLADSAGNAKDALDALSSAIGSLNKEYAQMRTYDSKGALSMSEKYYGVKRNLLDRGINQAKQVVGDLDGQQIYNLWKSGSINDETFDKYMDAYQKVQDWTVERNNLDDEEIQDKIDILSVYTDISDKLKEQYKELEKAGDTDLERLQYHKQYLDYLEKERDLAREIYEYNKGVLKDQIEYAELGIRPDEKGFDRYYAQLESVETQELDRLKKAAEDFRQEQIEALMMGPNPMTYEEAIESVETNPKYLSKLEQIREQENEIKDIDDERVQAAIDYLEILTGTNEDLINEYNVLITTADTEQELLEYTQKRNEAIREQNALIQEQLDFYQDLTQAQLQYEDSNPWSKNYNKFIKRSKEFYTEQKNNALANAKEYYQQAKDMWVTAGYSEEVAEAKAYYDEDYQQALQDYIEAYQNAADVTMRVFNDKIDAIERKIDQLNVTKPREWITTWKGPKPFETGLEKIDEYYTAMEGFYKDELEVAKATLEQIADLTDEQIDELVDKYNNTLKAILDNQISQAEDTKSYQESVYNALVNQIGRYKKELEDAKKIVEEQYDTEIKKLQDKNQSIERTNKLLKLQQNLQNAQKEKQRVYREGIGWTYETNREALKSAQKDLDDFYRQDTVDDLQATKQAELDILNERINDWDNYLSMLQQRYQEYQVLTEQRLLMETLEVESEQALRDVIIKDMTDFNLAYDGLMNMFVEALNLDTTQILALLSDGKLTLEELLAATGLSVEELTNLGGEKFSMAIQTNGQLAVDALSNFCNNYDTVFGTFLDDYTTNLEKLEELKKKELELLNAEEYNKHNGQDLIDNLEAEIVGGTGSSKTIAEKRRLNTIFNNADYEYIKQGDWDALLSYYSEEELPEILEKANEYGRDWNHEAMEELRKEMGISSNDSSAYKITLADGTVIDNLSGKEEKKSSDSSRKSSSSGKKGDEKVKEEIYNRSPYTDTSEEQKLLKQIEDAGKAWAAASTQAERDKAHADAEAARAKLGYSGGADGSEYIKLNGYDSGIERGPVTYTGLAMLHGSPSNPEYVLTNDQAYNLLNYMANTKPEINSKNVDCGTIYNFTGGITMNGVNDPEEFFAELMKATSNRFNVTKNK